MSKSAPVRFLKREGNADVSTDEADYISGRRNDPHANPAPRNDSFYSDHGRGLSGVDSKKEDKIQKGRVFSGPKNA